MSRPRFFRRFRPLILLLMAGSLARTPSVRAQPNAVIPPPRYDMGQPAVQDIWVDTAHGDDARTGATRDQAVHSLAEAWRRIPEGDLTSTGYRIMLAAGTYPEAALPNYLENRRGSFEHPLLIQAADGRGSVTLGGDLQFFQCRYVYLLDFNIVPEPHGDTLHFDHCDHMLVRGVLMDGGRFTPEGGVEIAHDNFKLNQCQYVYMEDSEVRGAGDNAVDFVAVQYGHIVGNKIHNSNDWAIYLKGGSAQFRIENNEIYDGGTGGLTMGQGTGFQFMVAPWLHYEAYDMKIVNNVIHDCDGAGLGVNGGYNILMAHNTLYRVGRRSHVAEFVFGGRACDGQPGDSGREPCTENLQAGGWGLSAAYTGDDYARIPNRNVFFYNNLIYNPPGYQSQWQQLAIYAPYTSDAQAVSNAPNPAHADDDLRIRGNLIWNGPADHSLGFGGEDSGCHDDNPACNPAQVRSDNAINTVEPQLADPEHGNYRPASDGAVLHAQTFALPAFPGGDRPAASVPEGDLNNAVARDWDGFSRAAVSPPGAFAAAPSPTVLKGDVNDDRVVNVQDAVYLLRIIAKLADPVHDPGLGIEDMNDDHALTVQDAILILRKTAGLP